MAAHGGVEVNCANDGLFIVFADATQAMPACVNAQKALTVHPWPDGAAVRVRMGLHTGMATAAPDDGYTALAVDQAACIAAAAHGGQVLVSAPTAGLLKNMLPPQAALAARGNYVVNDFDGPLGLYQLTHPDSNPRSLPCGLRRPSRTTCRRCAPASSAVMKSWPPSPNWSPPPDW